MTRLTQVYGPAVRCKRFRRSGSTVLHQCIRSLFGALAPDHHGYQRAFDLISGQASTGPFGSPVFACAGKTDPPLLVSSSRRPRRVDYIIDSLLISWLFLCSRLAAVPSSRPARADASRTGAVKAGRRACLASRVPPAARPRLDGPEHGARLTLDGTPSHRS